MYAHAHGKERAKGPTPMHHPITTHLITTHATTQDPDWTPTSILTLILGLAVTTALWAVFIQISGRWKP